MLFLINISYANIIEKQEITIDVSERGYSYFETNTTYSEFTTEDIFFVVFGKVSNLEASDREGPLDCISTEYTYGTEIICNPNYKNSTDYSFELNFLVTNLIHKSRENQNFRVFSYDMGIREPIDNLYMKVILPEGFVLREDLENSFTPEDGNIKSTGRNVIIEWNIEKPELGKTLSFNIYYEKLVESMKSGTFVIVMAIILIFLVLAVILLILYLKRHDEKVLSVLITDEKKIIEGINHYGDGCKQKDIVKYTNYSKAKVSRLIDALEKRGIVKRERQGKTVKLYILDKGLKGMKNKTDENKENKKEFI